MKYIKKISTTENLYYIKLPQKTSKVYLDISLKNGYAKENNKEFGVGHLLEHYLIRSFKKLKNATKIQVDGFTKQESIVFSLDSTRSKIIKEATCFIKSILNPEFLDNQIFLTEKEALINELYIKLNKQEVSLEEIVLMERFDQKCPYCRKVQGNIKNIGKIQLKDLEEYYNKFFIENNVIITFSAYQLSTKIINEILSIIKKYKLPNKPFKNKIIKCFYSKFKIKKIQNKNDNLNDVILSFPVYNNKIPYSQRVILGIFDQLLFDYLDELQEELRNKGIYHFEFEKISYQNIGVIYFYTHIMDEKLLSFLVLFNQAIKNLKNKEIFKNKLNLYKKQFGDSEKRAFNTNLDRIEWVNYDLIHYGKLISVKEDIEIINQITPKILRIIINNIFKKDLVNIIIRGKNVHSIDKIKIKKIINF